jgi:hypothetical protein
MTTRRMTAVLAALILGAGSAAACGSESGDRESVDKSNQGDQVPEGGNVVTETGPTTLQSTGTQPTVTQETGP